MSGGVKCQARVLGPMECAITSKLIRHGTGWGETVTLQARAGMESMPPNNAGEDPMFKFNGELLHGGQGKNNKLVNINCNHDQPGGLDVPLCTSKGLEGLNPPQLEETGGVILRDNKTKMGKENKRHWWQLKAEQDKVSQWATHQGNGYEKLAPQPHRVIEIGNQCALEEGHLPTQLWDSSPSGPRWAAPSTLDNHGQRKKSGRQWLAAPIDPHYHQRLLHIFWRRLPNRFSQRRHKLWHGMT